MSNNYIGIDITKTDRFEDLYFKYGDKFLERYCTEGEISYIKSKNNNVETMASIFSFKEAVSKVIGTGITKDTTFKDIVITYNKAGAPTGHFKGSEYKISASHDGGYVVTVAIGPRDILFVSDEIKKMYKARSEYGHKGSFGKVMVIASSRGMVGAGYLASMAALRSGAGLVYHYIDPEDDIFLPLSIKHTEGIVRDSDPLKDIDIMDCVLIGPGLGTDQSKLDIVEEMLMIEKPLVIDADGINILKRFKESLKKRKCPTIITPHKGEFKRLIGNDSEDLEKKSMEFAREYKTIVVLKDSATYITDGDKNYRLNSPNSALATAGSGDVLAGIITSLIAQGYDPYEGAVLGVNIHSLAGQVGASKYSKSSTLARDIVDSLKYVFRELES